MTLEGIRVVGKPKLESKRWSLKVRAEVGKLGLKLEITTEVGCQLRSVLSNFARFFPSSLGSFQLKHKPSNYRLSNFSCSSTTRIPAWTDDISSTYSRCLAKVYKLLLLLGCPIQCPKSWYGSLPADTLVIIHNPWQDILSMLNWYRRVKRHCDQMNNKLALKGQIKMNSMHDQTHFMFVACRFDSEK